MQRRFVAIHIRDKGRIHQNFPALMLASVTSSEDYRNPGRLLRIAMAADAKYNCLRRGILETRNLKLYCAAFPFTTIPISSGPPVAIFSLLANTQCSWPSLLTAGTVSEAGCTRFMGPG